MRRKLPTSLVTVASALCDEMDGAIDQINAAIDRNEENTLSEKDAREWINDAIADVRAALEEVEAKI